MKYIKLFKTKAQYEAFKASADYLKPNVSFIETYNEAHIEKFVDDRIILTFNITDTSAPTRLYYDSSNAGIDYGNAFTSIEVDGVELPTVVGEYTFTTTGEHIVKYAPNYDYELEIDGQNYGWDAYAIALFYDITEITSAIIPDGCPSSPGFNGCVNLETLVLPDSITEILVGTFQLCSSLKSVKLPKKLQTLSGFDSCSSLTSITIPPMVTTIGEDAFNGCSGLVSIHIPSNVTEIGLGGFNSCSGLTSLTIPSNVTTIGPNAFSYCSNISSLTIENGVESIGTRAFLNNDGLTEVTIPESITSIGLSAFENCDDLETVIYKASNCAITVTGTFGQAFNTYVFNNTPVKTIGIGKEVENIPRRLFEANTSIENVLFEKGRTKSFSLANYAFKDCTSLLNFDFDLVSSIGDYAFSGCESLSTITYNGDAYDEGKFDTPIYIHSEITNVGNYAFKDCEHIDLVRIDVDYTGDIGEYAFYGCTGMKYVVIETDCSIGSYAFAGCTDLIGIAISTETPPELGVGAFDNTNGCPIIVPDGFEETYKTEWPDYASRIISEMHGG